MKALKSANAQTTLSKRQQEQQAKIKKIAIAILIAILIFLALLMLESNLIQDETYTYVLTANSDISAGTVVNEQNYKTLFSATAISSRQSDEYNKITLDPDIPNFSSPEEAYKKLEEVIQSSCYTSKELSKMQYINVEDDITTYAQYIESSTTTTYYANGSNSTDYHKVEVIDPVDVAFNSSDAVKQSAGEIREGDIVEIGYTRVNSVGETEYVNGWSKDYNEPVLITRKYISDILRRTGYYTIYEFQVNAYDSGEITDQTGETISNVESKNLQRATIYVSDAKDTGGVLMQVTSPRYADAAGNYSVLSYETYFDNIAPGFYILTTNGWELYDYQKDYTDRQITPAEYDVNSHFMDLSATHVQAVLTSPGQTIGQNVEDAAEAIPQVYKIVLSKTDIQYFYKFMSAGQLIMTKIMNVDTDPHLVQPDYDSMTNRVESVYVDIKDAVISHNHVELEFETDTNTSQDVSIAGDTLDNTLNQIENSMTTEEVPTEEVTE